MAEPESEGQEIPEGYRSVVLPNGKKGWYPGEMSDAAIRAHISNKFKGQDFKPPQSPSAFRAALETKKEPGDKPFQGMFRAAGNADAALGIKTPEEARSRAEAGADLVPIAAGIGAGKGLATGGRLAKGVGAMLGGGAARATQEPDPGSNRLESGARTAAEIGAMELGSFGAARFLNRVLRPFSTAPGVSQTARAWDRYPIGPQMETQPGASIEATQSSRRALAGRAAVGGDLPPEFEVMGGQGSGESSRAAVWKNSTSPQMGRNMPDRISERGTTVTQKPQVVRDPSQKLQAGLDTASQVSPVREGGEAAGAMALVRLLNRFLGDGIDRQRMMGPGAIGR